MNVQRLLSDAGIEVQSVHPVRGGDINLSYRIVAGNQQYFIKLNDASRYPEMMRKEVDGLHALRQNSSFKIPDVVGYGVSEQYQYLLLEWIERGSSQKIFWDNFGKQLAEMHLRHQEYFGFAKDNYIGSLKQTNTPHQKWSDFYATCRIMPLVRLLFDQGRLSSADIKSASQLCLKLDDLFPAEPPALLHGDLWSGNYMTGNSGEPVLIDPAVYFGHREMDLGMTRLFGGFDDRMYESYQDVYPLQKGWQQRMECSQLYPVLVHAVLFGGGYVSRVKEILKRFTS